MLIIRDEQMQAFIADRRRNFEASLTAHLLDQFKEEVTAMLGSCDEAAVRAFVIKATDSALSYGIDEEDDVRSFVEIQTEMGPGFETRPGFEWASGILESRQIPSKAKIDLLLNALP